MTSEKTRELPPGPANVLSTRRTSFFRRTGSTRLASIRCSPSQVAQRPACTAISIARSISRLRFSTEGKLYGRAAGSKPRSTAVRRARRLSCWQFSTCSTDGFTKSRSRAALSLMCCWNRRPDSPVREAAAIHLAKIRAIVRGFAEEANLREPEKFAQVWHMLMKGSIVSAGEGNRDAARDAKCAARLVLDGWQRQKKYYVGLLGTITVGNSMNVGPGNR